ncbi:MAG: protoporphyrinogen oxidase [Alphaproteobacteria bacterium]|nr:MAG: protoporphyrinogen oxidase [Alphaproteobacteria bacterium]
MKILVAFGTLEGQTRKIAEAVAARVHDLGHDAHLFDTAGTGSPAELHVDSYDKIIVAGSVHHKRHQESVEDFVTAKVAELQKKPTLFLSVSLSAAFPEGMTEAQSYVDAFLAGTGWKPTQSLLVAGALQYTEYDYFQEQVIEHIVLKGRKIEGLRGDLEFTDWAALSRTVDSFVRS